MPLDPQLVVTGLLRLSEQPQMAVLPMGSGDGEESPAWKFPCLQVTYRQGDQNVLVKYFQASSHVAYLWTDPPSFWESISPSSLPPLFFKSLYH